MIPATAKSATANSVAAGARLLRVLPLLAVATWCGAADAPLAASSDEEAVWNDEQAIFAGRAQGDISFYVTHADPDYAGWPPQLPAPIGRDALVEGSRRAGGLAGETITLQKNLIRITDHGRLALSFFTTHRTHRGGGGAVDESFENIHVWVKDGPDWRIVGGMARPVPTHREQLSGPIPTPVSPGARAP